MNYRRSLAWILYSALVSVPFTAAMADEVIGKVVWIDHKNSSLLLECPTDGCQKIPNSKSGETYTFKIPENLRTAVEPLKEGQTVKLAYDDAKEKGFVITSVLK